MSRFTVRGWAGVSLLALAVFVIIVALLPQGPATLDALGGLLAQPILQLLLLVAVLGQVPWWLRRKD